MKDTRSSRLWHRITALALSVLMVLTILPATAMAAAPTSGQCGEHVTWSYDTATQTLTIRGTGPMDNYGRTDRSPWRTYYGQDLKTLTIADGVTVIGEHAFEGCSALENVSIPQSVVHIDWFAFQDCTSLKNLTLSEGLKVIDESAFRGCTSLESVTIPDSVTILGNDVFENCTSLQNVSLPQGLTAVNIYLFSGCTSLKSITIPEGVTSLGYSAFYNCSSLENINIPQSVTSIGALVMAGTAWEARQTEGLLYLDNCLLGWKDASPKGALHIRKDTRVIADSALSRCDPLTEVTIPTSVVYIGRSAFWRCNGLRTVSLPVGLRAIEPTTFQDCTHLENVTIPATVETIGERAFDGCSRLELVSIPGSVTTIGGSAFGHTALESVIIPESVTAIGAGAFTDCIRLRNVTLPENLERIGSGAFTHCRKLSELKIPANVTSIGVDIMEDTAWYSAQGNGPLYLDGCLLGRKYFAPKGAFEIQRGTRVVANSALYNCSGMTSVTIPEGVTSIGANAFTYAALQSVDIPESVTTIGGNAFSQCRGLQSVKLPEGLTTLGNGVFSDCVSLADLSIPESVTHVGSSLMWKTAWEQKQHYNQYLYLDNCLLDWYGDDSPSAPTLEIRPGTRVIAERAVGNSTANISDTMCALTIPGSVVSIGESAFAYRSRLQTVTFTGHAPQHIGRVIFDVADDVTAYYPAGDSTWTPDVMARIEGMNWTWVPCTPAQDLPAPQLSADLAADGGYPYLQWTAVPDAESYEIWGALANEQMTLLATVPDAVYIHTEAIPGRAYTYQVRAIAGEQKGPFSNTATAVGLLSAPQLLSVELNESNQPVLTWTAVKGAVSYRVDCVHNGVGPTTLATVEGMQFTHVDVQPGDNYRYLVAACGLDGGDSGLSNNILITIPAKTVLPAPQLDVTNTSSTGKPCLKWTAVDGAVKYEVFYATSKDGSYMLLDTLPASATSYTHATAVAGTSYYYQVCAVDANGTRSEFSNVDLRTCDLGRPDVKASLNADGKPVLTWQAIPGAREYLVYFRTDGGDFVKLTTVHGTRLTHGSAKPGHTYTYKVRAIASRSAANSAWSYYDTLKVEGLTAPTLTLTNTSSTGKPYLKWTAVDGAVKYEVYYSTSKTGTYKRLYTTSGTTLKHGSADAGTTYYYKVRAVDANGAKGEFSPYKLRTCDLARPDVKLTTRSDGKPVLDWSSISGAVKYDVYCSVDGGSFSRLLSVKSSKLTHSSAKRGHTYRYRVKAICSNKYGNSALSYIDTVKVK